MVCVYVMAFTDASLTALRVFREVAERGTLTAAATALGYTQSAVSRQIASSNAPPVRLCWNGVTTASGSPPPGESSYAGQPP